MAPFADGFFLDPVNKGSKITPSDPFGTVDANLTKFVYTESESISLELIDVIEFRKKSFKTLKVLPPTTPTPANKYPDSINGLISSHPLGMIFSK